MASESAALVIYAETADTITTSVVNSTTEYEHVEGGAHVDGAAQQRSSIQRLLDDVEQVGWGLLKVIALSNASSEILKAFAGRAPGQRLVAAVHSVEQRTAE